MEKHIMSVQDKIDPQVAKDEIFAKYPPKVARKRAKQFLINEVSEDGVVPEIAANTRTIPGILTMRGCSYAGCKGVVLGPTRDIVNITHGPIGCGFYSWLTRRNQTRPETLEDEQYMTYCFSTDMEESEIIFGGEKKLKQAIQEAFDNFHPKAISVFSTCPVGLIGDDVHQVCKEMKEKLGINVFGFSCEGYKGVSQSAGHHIANNQLFKHVIGNSKVKPEGKFKINMLGEYNIGGDAFVIENLLERCGITMVSSFSGNSTVATMEQAHHADLNCVMCHRSINYVADMIDKKYGVPWIKVNFIGPAASAKSLRRIAKYFGDKELIATVEKVIEEEMAKVEPVRAKVKERCDGKTAMLFVGASRAHHYQELFTDIGIKTIAAGYEFAHRDDYEGRKVLPNIKLDADSRNIEELEVEASETEYRPRKTPEEIAALEADDVPFKAYDGMMPEMDKDTLIIDDANEWELEKLLEMYKPDIYCAGIKEKYGVQKWGIPCKQLHSYDYGGPYAGFEGAINWYEEIDRLATANIWRHVKAPWQKAIEPSIEASLATA